MLLISIGLNQYYEYVDQLKSLDHNVIDYSIELSNNAKHLINCYYSNEERKVFIEHQKEIEKLLNIEHKKYMMKQLNHLKTIME